MQKAQKEIAPEQTVIKNLVHSIFKFKNARMMRITGSFIKGGFNISQNKLKAILDNLETVQKFVKGEYNKEIDELKEDEILKM